MKTSRLLVSTFLGFCALVPPSRANVTLPAIFSDHMALQRDASVPVWGWADAGEKVTVSINGQTKSATADANGKWKLKLDKLKAGDPTTLTVEGKNKIVVNDVLVGEVWLCSGQSNMGMTVDRSKDFDAEKAAANYPKIRHFREMSSPAMEPQEKGKGVWEVCSPETVGKFSATAYFFGREIFKSLNTPVGLVNSSVGGTPIEAWTSWDAQKDLPIAKTIAEAWEKRQAAWTPEKAKADFETATVKWKEAAEKAKAEGKPEPRKPVLQVEPKLDGHHPANLFNGKIQPLIPYAIRGAIWYQGEANAGSPASGEAYASQLEALVKDWRSRWGEGDFPFAWVQLPNFKARVSEPVQETSGWPAIRESFLKTLKLPNTGMAITIDVGEAGDIHPKNKQEVGKRLGLWALAKVYGKKVASSGPLPASHKTHGSEIVVTFKNTDGGLVAKEGELRGFAIAGADKKWVAATAKIKGDTVVVSSPDVKEPVAVRYAWADNPDCNLYNGAGIPATPFRTDDWPAPAIAPGKPSASKAAPAADPKAAAK